LKKVPQTPQKLPEKMGKNSHIAFFKWVNWLLLSLFREVFEIPKNLCLRSKLAAVNRKRFT